MIRTYMKKKDFNKKLFWNLLVKTMNTASSTLGNAPEPVQKLLNLLYMNPKKMEHLAESLKPKEEKPVMKVNKDGNFSLTL